MRRIWIVLLLNAVAAYAGSTPPFTSSPLTFSGVPNSVTLGSDGNLWLIDRAANKVGRLTPGGTYTTFAIPTTAAIASGITLGPDGNAWFAEFGPNPNKIARVNPDGVITEYSLPAGRSLGSIAAGPDGNVWFTDSASSNGPPVYSLGRISTADGSMADFALPTNGRAQGLVSGADGNLWIGWVESSGNKYDALRVTPSGAATSFPLPSTGALNALGATMLLGPDLNVWFTYQNNLARVKPDGTVTLYPIPTANSNMLPAGLAIGIDGNLWFTEFSSGKIGQLIISSATDSGQATINESDSFGGLPQMLFAFPSAATARAERRRAAPNAITCGDFGFVVQSQPATTSPSQLVVLKAPLPAKCADITIGWISVFPNAYGDVIGSSSTTTIVARVENDGPDDATNVTALLEVYSESSGMQIEKAVPVDAEAKPAIDGTCDPVSRGPAGAAWIIKCSWPLLPISASRLIEIVPRFPASPDYRSTWYAAAYAASPVDPKIKNNFLNVRLDAAGKDAERTALEPNIRGTVSVIRRGH